MDLAHYVENGIPLGELTCRLPRGGGCDCAELFQEVVPDTKANRFMDWLDSRRPSRLVFGLIEFLTATYFGERDVNWKECFPWYKECNYERIFG